jgi:DNA-binding transcriptional ArsR family regulator
MNMEISEAKVREGTFRFLAALFKVLSSPTRLKILDLLYHNPPERRTFSDIMFGVGKNPSVVANDLKMLQTYKLVEKLDGGNYKITEEGKLALNANARDIVEFVETALKVIAEKER